MDFNFSKLFDGFDTLDSLAILVFMILAFLFGMAIGFILRTKKVRLLKKELKDKKKELAELRAEHEAQQEQLELKDVELKKANFELEESAAKLKRLDDDKEELYKELYSINSQLEKSQASNKTYEATIEDLNNQLLGLKTKNDQLVAEMDTEDELVNDMAEVQSIYNATRHRLEAFDEKLSRLEGENQSLRVELEEIKSSNTLSSEIVFTEAEPSREPQEDPALNMTSNEAVLGGKIIIEEREKDDLTLINGIGPFLEKQLNESGIYTFEQISQFDEKRIEEVTAEIGFFQGRIERDNWVAQAAKLQKEKLENPLAPAVRKAHPSDIEDLKIIEGIGPKIEQVLKNAGVNNWQTLAESSSEGLREILDAAGERFRLHDPGTWPAQARLATNGEWELLGEYQDELKGGREVPEEKE